MVAYNISSQLKAGVIIFQNSLPQDFLKNEETNRGTNINMHLLYVYCVH